MKQNVVPTARKKIEKRTAEESLLDRRTAKNRQRGRWKIQRAARFWERGDSILGEGRPEIYQKKKKH